MFKAIETIGLAKVRCMSSNQPFSMISHSPSMDQKSMFFLQFLLKLKQHAESTTSLFLFESFLLKSFFLSTKYIPILMSMKIISDVLICIRQEIQRKSLKRALTFDQIFSKAFQFYLLKRVKNNSYKMNKSD